MIKKSRTLPATQVDGDLVMVDLEGGAYLAMDRVGQRIWEILDVPQTLASLCDQLCAEYDVTPDTCRDDVQRFVDQLSEARLVTVE